MGTGEHAGQCVCGAIRFKASGEPPLVTVCHCAWCQRRTGSAFGVEVVFDRGQIALEGDEPRSYRHVSDESGRWLDVYFCGRCGSNLGFELEARPGLRTLPAGAFDDTSWIAPDRHEFRHVFARTRRPWGADQGVGPDRPCLTKPLVDQMRRAMRER